MRRLLLLALVCVIPSAQAEWEGGTASTAASAYCNARAAGLSQKEASRRALQIATGSMTGSFESDTATILTRIQEMREATIFQIEQQCPEYSGGSSGGDAVPPQAENDCYDGKEMCDMIVWPE